MLIIEKQVMKEAASMSRKKTNRKRRWIEMENFGGVLKFLNQAFFEAVRKWTKRILRNIGILQEGYVLSKAQVYGYFGLEIAL